MGKAYLVFVIILSAASSASGAVKIIVPPLESLSRAASLRWLSEGMAMSVSEQLEVRDVSVIDRERRAPLAEALDLPPNSPLSRASMIRVAQEATADYLVMGSYSGTADNLQIVLRVLDMKSMKLGPKITANGPLAVLPQIENELAWEVLSSLGVTQEVSRERFKERARAIPNNAYSLYVRSLGLSDEDERMKLLARAVESYEDFPEAQFPLGRYLFQQGDYAKAVGHLQVARKVERDSLQAQFMLGTCFLKQENPSEAIQAYSHVLSLVRSYEVLNNMALAYMRKDDYANAIENLLEARKMAPGNLTIEINLAILRHLQGNDVAARDLLRQSIEAHPNIGMLNYLLSVVSNALGDGDAAAAALAQAKRFGLDPEKLSQDPKTWARVFTTWGPYPVGQGNSINSHDPLIVGWFVCGRNANSAYWFIRDLSERLISRIQLTTDGHKAYLEPVEDAFGANIDYAMIVKLYGKAQDETRSRAIPIRSMFRQVTWNGKTSRCG